MLPSRLGGGLGYEPKYFEKEARVLKDTAPHIAEGRKGDRLASALVQVLLL
ncbi:MAG: hypothetical protein ACFCU7_00390 [Pleurocapsa sp.]